MIRKMNIQIFFAVALSVLSRTAHSSQISLLGQKLYEDVTRLEVNYDGVGLEWLDAVYMGENPRSQNRIGVCFDGDTRTEWVPLETVLLPRVSTHGGPNVVATFICTNDFVYIHDGIRIEWKRGDLVDAVEIQEADEYGDEYFRENVIRRPGSGGIYYKTNHFFRRHSTIEADERRTQSTEHARQAAARLEEAENDFGDQLSDNGSEEEEAILACWLCAMGYDEGDSGDQMPMYRPSECAIVSCGHHLCLGCFRGYVHSKLTQDIIPCQHLECTAVYEENEIERYTAEDKYRTRSTKLTENMCQKALGDDWTTCPYDCGGDFMVDAELPYIVAQRCPECNRQVCGKCKQKWIIGSGQTHEDLTCQEWKRRMDPNYTANEAYLARNTKPCPNCRRPIEKDEGCNHMTCRRPSGCGREFCWTCLGPATQNGPCWISRCRTLSHPVEWH